jgi:predicted esterase
VAELREGSVRASIDCRYIDQEPDRCDPEAVIFALHGYSMNASVMLRLTEVWFPNHRIVSIEGPYPFYTSWEKREVGYSWAADTRSQESVRLHHEIVRRVFERSGVPPQKRVLLGFSQSVGLNYRFSATFPDEVDAVIGVCGGLSKEWETGDYFPVSASLLHIGRTEDQSYPIEQVRDFPLRLRLRARDVEYLEYPGGHSFPSSAGPDVKDWLKRRVKP